MAIMPTVGRVVWFYNSNRQTEPKAALVAKVWDKKLINVMVVEEDGRTTPVTSVRLIQEGEDTPALGCYATWLSYQIGQAKKATD